MPPDHEAIVTKLCELHMKQDIYGMVVVYRELKKTTDAQHVMRVDDAAKRRMIEVLDRTIDNVDLRSRLGRVITDKELPIDRLIGQTEDWLGHYDTPLSLYSFAKCKPLLYTFIAAMFDTGWPPLSTYYAATMDNDRFHIELAYLYLLGTDITVSERLAEMLFADIDTHLKELDKIITKHGLRFDYIGGKKQFPRDFKSPYLPLITEHRPQSCIPPALRKGFEQGAIEDLLLSLVACIPLILEKWDEMNIRHYVHFYARIEREHEMFSPRTPVGLYIHFCFMTPTHLELCMTDLYNT